MCPDATRRSSSRHRALPRPPSLDVLEALARRRVHRPDERAGQFPMTRADLRGTTSRRRLLAPYVGDADQGVHPAPARPRLVRDDRHDPADAADAVRLRDQHHPRHLPTAVLLQEQSDVGRSILKAIENTNYFKVTHVAHDEAEFDQLLASGTVLFAIEIPANFERAVRRGDRPALLVAADATDPVAAGSALGGARQRRATALRTTAPSPTAPRRRSRSAPTPATTRRPRPRSTSCRAWSAPS